MAHSGRWAFTQRSSCHGLRDTGGSQPVSASGATQLVIHAFRQGRLIAVSIHPQQIQLQGYQGSGLEMGERFVVAAALQHDILSQIRQEGQRIAPDGSQSRQSSEFAPVTVG